MDESLYIWSETGTGNVLESYWISVDEYTETSGTITAVANTDEDPTLQDPTSMTWELLLDGETFDLPPQLEITTSDNTINLYTPNWAGVFPFYVLTVNKDTRDVTRWDNTFEIENDLFFYEKDGRSVIEVTFVATASGPSGTESKSYTIQLFANYTPNAIEIKEYTSKFL